MVVKGKTQKPIPALLEGICRKNELKLLGITFNENPCNWDTQFENMMEKANSRLYMLRVCKYYDYSLEELSILFDSLITAFLMYGIEVWASAYNNKYLQKIDKFCKQAVRYGYTTHYIPIMERIRARDKQLWGKITKDLKYLLHSLLPPKKRRILRQRGHNFILPAVKTARFKRCFINRCLFNFI